MVESEIAKYEEITDTEKHTKLREEIGKRITLIRKDMHKKDFASIIRNKAILFNYGRKRAVFFIY